MPVSLFSFSTLALLSNSLLKDGIKFAWGVLIVNLSLSPFDSCQGRRLSLDMQLQEKPNITVISSSNSENTFCTKRATSDLVLRKIRSYRIKTFTNFTLQALIADTKIKIEIKY